MFETHSQEEFDILLRQNPDFRKLYHHHRELNSKVADAERGVLPVDDVRLMRMKREKLQTKQRLLRMAQARQFA